MLFYFDFEVVMENGKSAFGSNWKVHTKEGPNRSGTGKGIVAVTAMLIDILSPFWSWSSNWDPFKIPISYTIGTSPSRPVTPQRLTPEQETKCSLSPRRPPEAKSPPHDTVHATSAQLLLCVDLDKLSWMTSLKESRTQGLLLPICVDNAGLDGPVVWFRIRELPITVLFLFFNHWICFQTPWTNPISLDSLEREGELFYGLIMQSREAL